MLLKFINLLIIILFLQLNAYSTQTEQVSEDYKFIKRTIDSLLSKANNYIEINTSIAKQYVDPALYLSKKINYLTGQAKALEIIGRVYLSRDEYSMSLKFYMEFLNMARQIPDINEEIAANLRIAGLYYDLHNFELAEQYLEAALELASVDSLPINLGLVYYNFANLNYEMRNISSSTFYIHKAKKYLEETDNIESVARCEKLSGDLFVEEGRLDDAIHAYHQSMELFSKTILHKEKGILYTRLAHVYKLKEDIANSLKFNKLALQERESLGDLTLLSHSYVNLGRTYSYLNQNDSSELYLVQGLKIACKSGMNYPIQEAYLQLSNFYSKQNNYKAAIKYYTLFFEAYEKYSKERTKSEILATEIKAQLQDIEAQNLHLRQGLEIQSLELKNRSYSELITQLIIGVIATLLLILTYIYERNKLGKNKLERINKKLNTEVEERKQTEANLRRSEELFRFVTEHTLDIIVRMDRNFRYLYISPSVLRLFGYFPADPASVPPLRDLIPQSFQEELRIKYLEMIRTKEPVMLTHQSTRKDGSLFWSESLVNPIFDPKTGKIRETITVIRDITDRVAYEESLSENARQKELLLREIHHRVKNNFAILVSLMNMQKVSSHPGNFNDFLTELQGRIRTMSLVHELLYQSFEIDYIQFSEYLEQLISIISRAYNTHPVTINSTVETCILDVETALPLGLIANEILTNAFKYAFADQPDGELWIDLKCYYDDTHPEEPYTHTLTIRDNGPGLPKDFSLENQGSMGSQIITLLIEQLEGRLDLSGDGGATFTIYFSDEKKI